MSFSNVPNFNEIESSNTDNIKSSNTEKKCECQHNITIIIIQVSIIIIIIYLIIIKNKDKNTDYSQFLTGSRENACGAIGACGRPGLDPCCEPPSSKFAVASNNPTAYYTPPP